MSEKMFNPTEYKPPIYKLVNNSLIEWEYGKVGELYCWTITGIRNEDLVNQRVKEFNKKNNKIEFFVTINVDGFNMLSQKIDFIKDVYYLTLNSRKGKDFDEDFSNIGHNYEYGFKNLKKLIDYINSDSIEEIRIDKSETSNNKDIVYDNVNKPNHYQLNVKGKNIEVIDIIDEVVKDYKPQEAFKIANIIKYVLRANKKNGIEDLKKARKYIDMLVGVDNDK